MRTDHIQAAYRGHSGPFVPPPPDGCLLGSIEDGGSDSLVGDVGTALVTGAASGIGRATAYRLARSGWRVAGIDRQAVTIPDVVAITGDVLDERSLRSAVDHALSELGGLDALVCSAGVSGSRYGDGPIQAASEAFEAVIGTNLRGAMLTVSAAWSALAEDGGAVITVGSVLGLTGGGGPFRSHAYVASKGGLMALTRALAAEGRSVGIRANCVAPGLVETPLTSRAANDPDVQRYIEARQPLIGGPLASDDVAAAIAFLCSADARAITGQILAVDAGWGLDPDE